MSQLKTNAKTTSSTLKFSSSKSHCKTWGRTFSFTSPWWHKTTKTLPKHSQSHRNRLCISRSKRSSVESTKKPFRTSKSTSAANCTISELTCLAWLEIFRKNSATSPTVSSKSWKSGTASTNSIFSWTRRPTKMTPRRPSSIWKRK